MIVRVYYRYSCGLTVSRDVEDFNCIEAVNEWKTFMKQVDPDFMIIDSQILPLPWYREAS
jgi:hypothetical protein